MMRVMPLLQQQQDGSSAIRLVMTHMMASYSVMKVRGLRLQTNQMFSSKREI
jgi:hypothetical protein